jgi:hypothetical protein
LIFSKNLLKLIPKDMLVTSPISEVIDNTKREATGIFA